MTKNKFRNRVKDFKKEMLVCRNPDRFKTKWDKEFQVECYIYKNWCIETSGGMYDFFLKNYYKIVEDLLKSGVKINDLKDRMLLKIKDITDEMDKRFKRDKEFDYTTNEEIIYEFCYCVSVLTKMKLIPSSNEFGILKSGKKVLSVVEVY